MAGAILDAIRRFRWIRRMAREGAAKEALILTRSLLSIALRAAYLTLPDDDTERRRRYLQLYLRGIDDLQKLSDRGVEHGFDPLELPRGAELARGELREIEGVGPEEKPSALPNDAELSRLINLEPFYSGIYMPTSDVAHFGIAVALDEVHAEAVDLDTPDPERSEAALSSAVLVFGFLIHASERSLGHSLGAEARRIVVAGQLSRGERTLGDSGAAADY
jgi:hypothetical protein